MSIENEVKSTAPPSLFFSPYKVPALTTIFTAYGVTTDEKQLDILRSLYLAGCLDPQQLRDDLEATGFEEEEISAIVSISMRAIKKSSAKKSLVDFDAELFLSEAFSIYKYLTYPEKVHNWLIRITQREFFARSPGQERWQQQTGQWMIEYEKEAQSIVKCLDLENEVGPRRKEYDAIAVFGGRKEFMEARLLYAKNLLEDRGIVFNHLYLLCGERTADPIVDGGKEYIAAVATEHKTTPDKVTETHLMQKAYELVKGESKFAGLAYTIIDTPRGNKPRPTTVDTLVKLSEEKHIKTVKSIAFISRAPHIFAQGEDTRSVVQEKFPQINHFEVIGSRCEKTPLKEIMGAFGGYLFGGYPRVAMELGSSKTLAQLKDKTKELGFVAPKARTEPISETPRTEAVPKENSTIGLVPSYSASSPSS